MADTQLTNPAGLNSLAWSTDQVIEEYLYDPNVTTSTTGYANGVGLVNGMVVFLYGGYNQTGGSPYSGGTSTAATGTNVAVVTGTSYSTQTGVPIIRKTPSAGSLYGMCGVVINAPTGSIANAATPTVTGGYQPGQLVQVVVRGITPVLVDANAVTPGGNLIWGTTLGGAATYASAPTLGKTVGVPLAYQAAPTSNALVPTYVNLV
jgi:hypothetical protein